MSVVNYYSIESNIIAEETAGVRTDYLTDGLGSVTATVNSSGTLLNAYRYKPYGDQLAKTGANPDPRFTWLGTHGYRYASAQYCDIYVRARHYSRSLGRWNSEDPIGFSDGLFLYAYALNAPSVHADPSGLTPQIVNCACWPKDQIDEGQNCINKMCDKSNLPKILECAQALVGISAIPAFEKCFTRWCSRGKNPFCSDKCDKTDLWDCYPDCPKPLKPPLIPVPGCAMSSKQRKVPKPNPKTDILFCCFWPRKSLPEDCEAPGDCLKVGIGQLVAHELGHQCGAITQAGETQVIIFAQCVVKALGCNVGSAI